MLTNKIKFLDIVQVNEKSFPVRMLGANPSVPGMLYDQINNKGIFDKAKFAVLQTGVSICLEDTYMV